MYLASQAPIKDLTYFYLRKQRQKICKQELEAL